MKKWFIVFGSTFAAGMLLILAVGIASQSLREDVPEENPTEIVKPSEDEDVAELAEPADSSSEETIETTESTELNEPDPVEDPSLVWKYEGIENTVDPSEINLAIHKGKTEYYMDLFIDSNHFKRQWLSGYTDGQPTIALSAQNLLDYEPAKIFGDHMEKGLHSLELVQYEDNDDENGEIIFYVRTTYEIK